MNKDKIEEIIDLFETLVDLDVRFYYESEEIPHMEIKNIEINDDGIVSMDSFDGETFEVEIEEFIDNYSKEGMSYHTWNTARNFDEVLNSL